MRRFFASVLEVLEVAVVAVAAVFLIRSFIVQPFLVSGASMAPNFSDGDYLLIDEVTYRFRTPERGEVVVFRSPTDPSVYFIKRIIGLPGEKVEIRGGRIYIYNDAQPDGFTLDEPYLPKHAVTAGAISRVSLSGGEYFLMGDNRNFSFDSRSWGALGSDKIIGLVRLRLWPVRHIEAFAAPQY